jgi:hypothetical protein
MTSGRRDLDLAGEQARQQQVAGAAEVFGHGYSVTRSYACITTCMAAWICDASLSEKITSPDSLAWVMNAKSDASRERPEGSSVSSKSMFASKRMYFVRGRISRKWS